MKENETKIYTKGGDKGDTSLLGGTRVSKSHLRVEAYGTLDELVAFIGVIRDHNIDEALREEMIWIQERLFTAESWVAADSESSTRNLPLLNENDIERLEKSIDRMNETLPKITHFILPGGHPAVSCIHVARTVCRRAERTIVRLHENGEVNPQVVKFLNRLSDYLFVASRAVAARVGVTQTPWFPNNNKK
ncbi:MAG: cob(I)yrinic acid a,c-diamide adenosyltransferase [Bacteroidia bacterium]|nr:cob(I)yrinic acid a,c-diamide adenosyltransferase [Bacteroidales bacterium]MDD2322619.1 cob(I)yrinic acid a,c-diamide adenosyltransferase [Bacteroidales bacterium]NCD42792.1 cob(I)yrinic acid a,c-diamide adenosyltransferase [Bacteroidia bacterium]